MEKDSSSFDLAALMKIAKSPAGQRLLSLVQKNRDEHFEEAMHQAEAGDSSQAQALLRRMLSTEEAQDLIKEIRGEK